MNAHLKALAAVFAVLVLGAGIWVVMTGEKTPEPAASRGLETLPDLQLKTIDGRDVRTADLKGKTLVVNFWASWCGPCIEEVPSLVKLSKEVGSDMHILAISGDATVQDIEVFLKSFPEFSGPGIDIVFDEGLRISKQFNTFRLPESYIFNGQGKMVRKVVGSINWSTPEAVEYIKGLAKAGR